MAAAAGPRGGREQIKQPSDAADHALDASDSQNLLPIARDPLSIATHPSRGTPLSEDAARTLTDAIRRDATALWMMLLRAFEGNAHGSLGYASWGAYCAAELQIERSRSYRLIDAARVAEIIQSPMGDSAPQSTMVDSQIPSERVARALAPLLEDPDELRATYIDAVATAPRDADGAPKVTARHVTVTVERKRQTLRPNDQPAEPISKHSKTVGINDAVAELSRAVERDHESAQAALATLRDIASRGLYGPQTRDPSAAFRGLIEIVALLLGRAP